MVAANLIPSAGEKQSFTKLCALKEMKRQPGSRLSETIQIDM
jgi:hypothetical protein